MKRKTFFSLLLVFIGLGQSLLLNAQDKITGRILDEHKKGVDAAVVLLVSLPDSVVAGTAITDSLGLFSFPLQKGSFSIHVRMLGYKEITKNVVIEHVGKISDIALEPTNVNLKEVIVKGRKSKPVISSFKGETHINVTNTYLENLGNALEVLKHSPSVLVNNKGEVSLATIGGTSVYVNGKRILLQGEELTAYLRSLSASKILKIETSFNPNASFDTDGAGGIINIILNSNEKAGTFLTTSHGVSYWNSVKQNSDIAFSYNTNKWQLGVNYNHSIGHYAMNYGYDKIQNGDKSVSETRDKDKRNTYSAGIDFSWKPNNKNNLFVNSNVNVLAGPGKTSTTTFIYKGLNTLDGILKAQNDYKEQQTIRYNHSVNYRFQPSKNNQLSASLDWTHLKSKATCEQPNSYFSANNSFIRSDVFHSYPNKDIDVYAILADYKCVFNEHNELISGIKASLVQGDNTFLFKKNDLMDAHRSNIFNYNEQNFECFTQFTHAWKNVELSVGLRVEYMHTHNKLTTYLNKNVEEHGRNGWNIFPNISMSYNLNDKGKVAIIYSRRQDKPRYEDLNPFDYLLDELSYWKGNPFLTPQISNKIGLNYMWKNLSINVYYNQLDDYFTSFTDAFEDNKTIMTTKNIGTQKQLGIDFVFSKRLTPWWDFSSNAGLYHFVNKLRDEQGVKTYKQPYYLLSANNSFLLPLGVNLDVSGRYYSKRQGGSYEICKPSGSFDVGINKSWNAGRMKLSLLITDVLHTERWDTYGTKGTLNLMAWGDGESRKVILQFNYNFGKQKWHKDEQNIDELNRL